MAASISLSVNAGLAIGIISPEVGGPPFMANLFVKIAS